MACPTAGLETVEIIVRDIERRKQSGKWKETRYIPYLATYLDERRWEDGGQATQAEAAASGGEEIDTPTGIIVGRDGGYLRLFKSGKTEPVKEADVPENIRVQLAGKEAKTSSV